MKPGSKFVGIIKVLTEVILDISFYHSINQKILSTTRTTISPYF